MSAPLIYAEMSTYPRAPKQVNVKIETATASSEPQEIFMFIQLTRADNAAQSYYCFLSEEQARELFIGLGKVFAGDA